MLQRVFIDFNEARSVGEGGGADAVGGGHGWADMQQVKALTGDLVASLQNSSSLLAVDRQQLRVEHSFHISFNTQLLQSVGVALDPKHRWYRRREQHFSFVSNTTLSPLTFSQPPVAIVRRRLRAQQLPLART